MPQDYGEALKWYRRSAGQGSAHGEGGLGAAYYYGYGVKPDYAESIRWYRKAAEQGDAAGEAGLGYLYQHGNGVSKDYAEALRWYLKAANQGQKLAERELGELYYNGEGVPHNYGQAFSWSYKGAAQGDVAAEYAVGSMYWYGQGVQANRNEAVRWFRRAAQDGNQDARRFVSVSLSPVGKWTLVIQLVVGIWFALGFLWERRRGEVSRLRRGTLVPGGCGAADFGRSELVRICTPLDLATRVRSERFYLRQMGIRDDVYRGNGVCAEAGETRQSIRAGIGLTNTRLRSASNQMQGF